MSRVLMVHHVNVQSADRERTRRWYERVLGATLLDRGPALNRRQLQMNIGCAEVHFSDVKEPQIPRPVHFALEVRDWNEMLAHLELEGVEYTRTGHDAFARLGTGNDDRWARREDNGEHFTYIHDPDGNLIELVHHPLGLVDSEGTRVELLDASNGLRWRQLPEVEEALGKTEKAAVQGP